MGEPGSPATALIEAAAAGNMGAFSEIVRLYRMRVLRVACGIVGSAEEAEDVAQEVFVKLWNSLPNYQAQSAFDSWLYRITVNAAIDALRKRRRELPLEDELSRTTKEPPEEAALRNETRRQVQQAIQALPEAARVTLILREYEQLSYKQIADVLQIPIGTVMSRLNYARQLLKKSLDPQSLERR